MFTLGYKSLLQTLKYREIKFHDIVIRVKITAVKLMYLVQYKVASKPCLTVLKDVDLGFDRVVALIDLDVDVLIKKELRPFHHKVSRIFFDIHRRAIKHILQYLWVKFSGTSPGSIVTRRRSRGKKL
jgi:hypothetical protein